MVTQVGGIARELGVAEEFFPVVDQDLRFAGGEAAEVIHERVDAAVLAGAGADVFEHGVVGGERSAARERVDEALEKNAVDSVLLHPRKMAHDGRADIGTEDLCALAIGVNEIGRETFGGGELGEVGPHVDPDFACGGRHIAAGPVVVAALGPVALGVEPTLVAHHDFASERRRIDARRGGSEGRGAQRGEGGEKE